jgi:hypothetical protein
LELKSRLIANGKPSTALILFLWLSPSRYFCCFGSQNDCKCRAGVGRNATLLMATSVAPNAASLPDVCTNTPEVMPNYSGRCVGGSNISAGLFDSVLGCWNECWNILGEQTWYAGFPSLCPSTCTFCRSKYTRLSTFQRSCFPLLPPYTHSGVLLGPSWASLPPSIHTYLI